MFGLGYAEMMIVGVVAVLLFGGRLPQVARSMGRSLTEFKKGMQDLQSDMSDVMDTSAVQSEPTGSVGYDPELSDTEPGPVDYHHEESGHEESEDQKFQPPTSPPTVEPEAAATETS